MKDLQNKIAVITGVGSGIGRGLAISLAKEGCQLALNEYNKDTLAETVQAVQKISSKKVIHQAFDVSKRTEMEVFADNVLQEFGQVDLVINNAGVALGKVDVANLSYDDFEWIMNINFWGMVYGSKSFLPELQKQKEAALVNISSVFGLAGIAHQAAYCASKFAIRGFTESLRMEALESFPHVSIHSVHPGGINTNIVKYSRNTNQYSEQEHAKFSAAFQKLLKSDAQQTADQIVAAIKKKKIKILVGDRAKQLDMIVRLFPERYSKILLKDVQKTVNQ